MKKIFHVVIVFLIPLLICSNACVGGGMEKQDDLTGIYIGLIPDASCLGIVVVAILNAEGDYGITYQYINNSTEIFIFTGTYIWDRASKMITLDSKELPPYYRVDDQGLTQLDLKGKEIPGNLGDLYKLKKVKPPIDAL